MRWLALVGVVLAWSGSAFADPVTYSCARTATDVFYRDGDSVEVSRFQLDESAQALVIDWDAARLTIGPSQQMPAIIEEHRVVGLMQQLTPAGRNTPEQWLYGTYILDRTTGVLTGDVHVLMGRPMAAMRFAYQCRAADGGTRF